MLHFTDIDCQFNNRNMYKIFQYRKIMFIKIYLLIIINTAFVTNVPQEKTSEEA